MEDNMKCPHPTHTKQVSIEKVFDTGFSCNDSGCKLPSIQCSNQNCNGINRTYAKYCTTCGKKIDFYEAYNRLEKKLEIDNEFNDIPGSYSDFYEHDSAEILSMVHYLGYLFVNLGHKGVLLFNGFNPKLGVIKKFEFDAKVISIDLPNQKYDQKKYVLITSESGVCEILINSNFDKKNIYTNDTAKKNGRLIRRSFSMIDGSIVVFFEAADGKIHLRHIDCDSSLLFDKMISSEISMPKMLDNQDIFFYNKSTLCFYKKGALKKYDVNGMNLNLDCVDTLIDENTIYLPGVETPYKFYYPDENVVLIPVVEKKFGSHRISLSNTKNRLYVSHNQGLTIINPNTDEIIWDMKSHMNIGGEILLCGQAPAREVGNYLNIIIAKSSGHHIRFIPKDSLDDLFITKPDFTILYEPIVILNNLIYAVQVQGGAYKIKVVKLCK
jgi:hypothetical protein